LGALAEWLGRDGWDELVRDHLGAQPFARPGVARAAVPQCSWPMLEEALGSDAADVLVVRGGRDLPEPRPRSLTELRALFEQGSGIALRKAEQASATVGALASSMARDVPGEQRVIVFATPAQTHGFGWHFDPEEVFVVQTSGVKTYYLRANTVCPKQLAPCAESFARYALETSPLLACDLEPGDLLYIPSGYWHMAYARRTSLSVSIGVLPDSGGSQGVDGG